MNDRLCTSNMIESELLYDVCYVCTWYQLHFIVSVYHVSVCMENIMLVFFRIYMLFVRVCVHHVFISVIEENPSAWATRPN